MGIESTCKGGDGVGGHGSGLPARVVGVSVKAVVVTGVALALAIAVAVMVSSVLVRGPLCVGQVYSDGGQVAVPDPGSGH